VNLLDRVRNVAGGIPVLGEWLVNGICVDQHTAQSRANKCLVCPLNQPGPKIVDFVAEAIHKQLELKNAMKLRVIGEKSLHSCKVCDCNLPLKMWPLIEQISLDKDEIQEFKTELEKVAKTEDDCWLVRESKALCPS
jgi:hypothetical protein